MVLRTPDPIAASEGPNRLMLAALYTPIHFILFALFGVLVVFLMHRAKKQPSLLMLALMLFAVFEGGFTGLVAILEQTALGDLAWYQVAIGNLIAVIVMGWYVWRRHPDVPAIWSRRGDDNG
jgi:FtsH-binding integral membrane protein